MPAGWFARTLFDLVISDDLGASGLDSSWQDHEPASTFPLALLAVNAARVLLLAAVRRRAVVVVAVKH